jgi:hypothetical protein
MVLSPPARGACRRLLPNEEVRVIRYFTARVTGKVDPGAPLRQDIYLRAPGGVAPPLNAKREGRSPPYLA